MTSEVCNVKQRLGFYQMLKSAQRCHNLFRNPVVNLLNNTNKLVKFALGKGYD